MEQELSFMVINHLALLRHTNTCTAFFDHNLDLSIFTEIISVMIILQTWSEDLSPNFSVLIEDSYYQNPYSLIILTLCLYKNICNTKIRFDFTPSVAT